MYLQYSLKPGFATSHVSSSDHFPLALQLNEADISPSKQAKLSFREKLVAPANAQAHVSFSEDLDVLLDSHGHTGVVETDYSALREFVLSTCRKHDLHKKQSSYTCKAKWFDKDCLNLKINKDRALRAMRRASCATGLDELISIYKDCNNNYKRIYIAFPFVYLMKTWKGVRLEIKFPLELNSFVLSKGVSVWWYYQTMWSTEKWTYCAWKHHV